MHCVRRGHESQWAGDNPETTGEAGETQLEALVVDFSGWIMFRDSFLSLSLAILSRMVDEKNRRWRTAGKEARGDNTVERRRIAQGGICGGG